MAALCPGVQYGLSSHQNFGDNKDLIFVKLTDSALRAIAEYLKNQNKVSQTPKIRFLGNENGELSFPSVHHDSGSTSFKFSMSSTADMGGPGGSFECLQQLGSSARGQLESLGAIPYKIRVHANEDVYEATRNRMTEVEDKYKNKCTREIKPNQTDIGRKVKVKQSSRPPILPTSAAPISRREPLPSMRDSLLKQPPPSYQPVVQPKPQPPAPPTVHSSTNGYGPLGSNHVSSSVRPMAQQQSNSGMVSKKPSEPSIARRPLKERLIHLLAVRPLKKVELYDRLTKEGFRGTSYTSVLKQIAHMKDMCYHLNRNMWNEVQEDWPYYSENEKQALKRRKPQNLTPPGSSDGGSSGSGQSPTSTHPGSPPPPITAPPVKRPGFHDGPDGFSYKRQRIAHGNKTGDSLYRTPPVESNNSQRRPATDLRDSSNMNPRSRESPTNGYFNSSPYTTMLNNTDGNVGDPMMSDNNVISNKRQCDSQNNSLGFGGKNEKAFRSQSPVNNSKSNLMTEEAARKMTSLERNNSSSNINSNNILRENGHTNGSPREKEKDKDNITRRNNNSRVTSSTQRISRVSPDSQSEGLPMMAPPVDIKMDVEEFPDFRKEYVTINDVDQRRRYKTDFNADYAEYRDLHGIVEKVSKRFAQLEERLKQENESSQIYKDIKRQIVREYQENKKDLEHQKAKRRFQYLHEKLSHIKGLVNAYDNAASTREY